jgi:hypothetical protein
MVLLELRELQLVVPILILTHLEQEEMGWCMVRAEREVLLRLVAEPHILLGLLVETVR